SSSSDLSQTHIDLGREENSSLLCARTRVDHMPVQKPTAMPFSMSRLARLTSFKGSTFYGNEATARRKFIAGHFDIAAQYLQVELPWLKPLRPSRATLSTDRAAHDLLLRYREDATSQ